MSKSLNITKEKQEIQTAKPQELRARASKVVTLLDHPDVFLKFSNCKVSHKGPEWERSNTDVTGSGRKEPWGLRWPASRRVRKSSRQCDTCCRIDTPWSSRDRMRPRQQRQVQVRKCWDWHWWPLHVWTRWLMPLCQSSKQSLDSARTKHCETCRKSPGAEPASCKAAY